MNEALQQRLLKVFETEHAEHLACMRDLLEQASQTPLASEELNEIFRRAHSLKGAARAVGLDVLQNLAHQLESLLQAVRQGQQPLDASTRSRVHRYLDFCENWLQAKLTGQPPPDPSILESELQPPVSLNGSEATAQPPSIQPGNPAAVVQDPEQVRLSTRRLEQLLEQAEALQLNYQLQQHEHEELNRLMQGADRLSLASLKALWQRQQESYWQRGQRQHQLEQTLRQIRLLPARQLFQIFPKMVRELAQEQGKDIEVHFSGLDQTVDRTVLQWLKDPIMHILRNAVGHGIETPAERQQAGKSTQGQIHCSLSTERHQLCICIQDDGRGLNWEALQSQPHQETSDLTHLLFQPGFSTARSVDNLQGRGMGLSVVAEAVRKLQGTYRLLEPETGFGLELRVPLQIASIPLLIVQAGPHTLALPGHAIQRLLRSQPEAIVRRDGKACIATEQTRFLNCYALSEALAAGPLNSTHWLQGLLLQANGQAAVFWVDEILSYREALLKPLQGPAAQLPHYLGAILSRTGQAIPVLDPAVLLAQAEQQTLTLSLKQTPKPAEAPLILVVDDSITTRTLEKSILESRGYRVHLAVNGQDALQLLRKNPVDLVVSDLQMPVMDGMALLRAIKADPGLQHLPVIIVTSVEDQHTRHEGLLYGASAYLVKQKFDQQELLSAIEALL